MASSLQSTLITVYKDGKLTTQAADIVSHFKARDHEDEFIELVTKSNAKSVEREIRESKKEFEQAQARISKLGYHHLKDFTKITSKAKSAMSVS